MEKIIEGMMMIWAPTITCGNIRYDVEIIHGADSRSSHKGTKPGLGTGLKVDKRRCNQDIV
jgi:hypothetical protein